MNIEESMSTIQSTLDSILPMVGAGLLIAFILTVLIRWAIIR